MTPLFEELDAARFTFVEMDNAYQDGIEDLADKVIELVQQSDFTLTLEDLVQFLEAEKGFSGDLMNLRELRVKDPTGYSDPDARYDYLDRFPEKAP